MDLKEDSLFVELRNNLDKGESAAIKMGIENEADLILLDEKEGRKTAKNHGLKVTGVIGILLKADREGKIDLEKQLDNLQENGFWISENLYERLVKG